ncbi:MAG: septum formation initiator family protein [Mogibacterium sp.]|nr:septum formation initiator family protein [Mogibacterium sp.]
MANTKRKKRGKRRRINRTTAIILVVVGLVLFASVRNIVSLKIENHQLKKENEELRQLKKELTIELKNVNSKEYVEERARRQLRLVNPDEILFVFPGDDRYGQSQN